MNAGSTHNTNHVTHRMVGIDARGYIRTVWMSSDLDRSVAGVIDPVFRRYPLPMHLMMWERRWQ